MRAGAIYATVVGLLQRVGLLDAAGDPISGGGADFPSGVTFGDIGEVSTVDDMITVRGEESVPVQLESSGSGSYVYISGGDSFLDIYDGEIRVGADVLTYRSISILQTSADPSAGAGVVAPVGSILMRTTGELWIKTGSGDTAWTRVTTTAD